MSSMRLVLLAASAKRKHYCLAGRKWHEDETHLWIRPVGNSLPDDNDALTTREIQFKDYRIPQVLDVVDVHLLRKANHPVQAENFLIDTSFRWKKVGTLPVNKLDQFVEYPDTLWFNPQQHYGVNDCFPSQLINGQTNSLYFIIIEDLVIRVSHSSYNRRKRYHGLFEYNQINYKISITDTIIYSTYGQKEDGDYHYGKCYATLSMAPFSERNECYKFLAALIKIQD
ncbi:TPA: hypothetical protein JLI98_002156 [Escherichia coli]|nr:hypothetical protein [Escherichia coli]